MSFIDEIPIPALREMFDLDPATGALTWKTRGPEHFATLRGWRIFSTQFAGKACGSPEGNGYLQCRVTWQGNCRLYKAHRIVWALTHGKWPDLQIDHKSLDRAANSPTNLREASDTQNQCNRAARSDSATGVKGVRFDASRGKYRARISAGKKSRHLGRFATLEAAAEAYARAAAELHGEFARTSA